MSKTVDNRVVQMTFDNEQFEKGVKQSMNSLNQLDDSLKKAGKGNDNSFSGITNALNNLQDSVSKINPLRWNIWNTIIDAAKNVGSKLAGYIFSPLEQAASGGWARAMNIENAKFQLEGMGLDVEKAMQAAMNAVNDTAFALDEAASVASQLGASGIEAGDQMEGVLKAISGVASVTNRSFQDIGMVFLRASGAGRVTGDTLMELSVRGLNAAATLGKAFGKTEADIRKMVSKGKISFQEFADIMQEKYADQAFKANETFQGSLANLKSALNKIGADFSQHIIKEAIPVFNSLRLKVNELRKELSPAAEEFGKILHIIQKFVTVKIGTIDVGPISKMIDGFANILSFAIRLLGVFKDAVKEMFPNAAIRSFDQIATSFRDFTERLTLSTDAIQAFKAIIQGAIAFVDLFRKLIVGIASAILPGVDSMSSLVSVVINLFAVLGRGLVLLDQWITENNVIATTVTTVKNALVAVLTVLIAVGLKVAEIVKNIKDSEIVANIISKVTTKIEELKTQFNGFKKTVSDVGNAAGGSGDNGEGKGGIFGKLSGVFEKFLAILKKVVGEITPAKVAIAAFVAFIGGIAIAITVAFNKLSNSVQSTSNSINKFWNVYAKWRNKADEADKKKEKTKKWASFLIIVAELTALAFALKGLASQPWYQIIAATAALTFVIYEVWKITDDIARMPNKEKVEKNLKSMKGIALLIVAVGAALSIAAKKPWAELLAAGIAMSLCMQAVIKTIKVLSEIDTSKISQTLDIMGKLSAIVAAFPVIASGLKKLQTMNVGQILAASIGMSACILAIGQTIKTMSEIDDSGINLKKIASILALCLGANLIGSALAKTATENWAQLAIAAVGIAGTILAMSGVVWVLTKIEDGKKAVIAAGAILAMSLSLIPIAEAISKLGFYNWEDLAQRMVALNGTLIIMGVVLGALAALSEGTGGVGAVIILAISAALIGMGYAMELASKGIAMIAQALKILQVVDLRKIALGMLDIAGAVQQFPVMKTIGLAAACMLGGNGFLAFAKGIQEFANADLSNLASNVDALFQAIAQSSTSFVEVGANLTALGLGLQTIAEAVKIAGLAMVPLGIGIAIAGVGIMALGAGLKIMAPALVIMQDLDWMTLGSGMAYVAESIGKLAIAGVAISLASAGLSVGAIALGAIAVECWGFSKLDLISIAKGLATIATTGQKLGLAGVVMIAGAVGVGGMAIAISALGKAVATSAVLIANGVKISINALQLLVKAGTNAIQGFVNGITAGLSTVAKIGANLGSILVKAVTTVLGIHSPSTVLRKIGEFTGLGFCNGVADMMDDAERSGKSLGLSAILGTEGLGNMASKAGQALGLDFSNGFAGVIDSLLGGVGRKFSTKGGNGMPSYVAEQMDKASTGLPGLTNSIKDLLGVNLDLDESLKDVTSSAGGAGEALSGMGDDAKKGAKGVKEAKDEITSFVEKIEGSFNILDEFDLGLDEENPLTKDKLLSNMRSNIEGMAKWSNEMESLSGKVAQGLYKKLADMGPQGYKYVHAFTEMTKEELEQVNAYYATSLVVPTNVTTQIYRGMASAGENAYTGYINGLNLPQWQELGVTLATDFLKGMKTQLGIASPSKETYSIGSYSTQGLTNGLKDASAKEGLFYTVSSMCRDIISKFRLGLSATNFKQIGEQVVRGLVNGINDKAIRGELDRAINSLTSTIESRTKKNLDIHSPSRVFAKIGEYVDLGLAKGITDNISSVDSSVDRLAQTTIDNMQNAVSTIQSVIESDLDVEPVIRPVVDLSDVNNGTSAINSLMSGFGSNVTMPQANFMTTSQLISNTDNSNVVDAVVALQEDVIGLKDAMTNIKMVLDTGTMVGAMTPAIDQELGMRQVYAGRSM